MTTRERAGRPAPTAEPARVSLVEFAKTARRPVIEAWLTTIPEWPEVEAAWKGGVGGSVIRRWLAEKCGYGELATENKVAGWLRDHIPRDVRSD